MTRKPPAALLICNSSSRQGATTANEAGAILEREGVRTLVVESHTAEETVRVVRERAAEIDRVIVAGGDGTVHSAATVLRELRLPLGVLPLGTANDLARSLGLPEDLEEACGVIARGFRCAVDLGVVNDHFFFNAAHVGLGVEITRELTPDIKRHWGVLSYVKALTGALSRKRAFKVDALVDGCRHRMRSIQFGVGNGRYYGGGNIVDEDSMLDDGRLHLYSLQPQTFWGLLLLAPAVRYGKHHYVKRVLRLSGERVRVETFPTSLEVHADGEPVTSTPADFSVLAKALEIYVPENSCTEGLRATTVAA